MPQAFSTGRAVTSKSSGLPARSTWIFTLAVGLNVAHEMRNTGGRMF